MEIDPNDYYSKFITIKPKKKNELSVNKCSKGIKREDEDIEIMGQEYITNDDEGINYHGDEEISKMTFNLYVNQRREKLYDTFLQNQKESHSNCNSKPRQYSNKSNYTYYPQERKMISHEVIKTTDDDDNNNNEQMLRNINNIGVDISPIVNKRRDTSSNKYDDQREEDSNKDATIEREHNKSERGFQIENIQTDRVSQIYYENPIQIQRDRNEQEHISFLKSKFPCLLANIQQIEQEPFFVKNKYTHIFND